MYHNPYILHKDFVNLKNKCSFFEEINIITGETKLYTIEECRLNENMCGKEGKYWEKSDKIKLKKMYHKIQFNYICFLVKFVEKLINYIETNKCQMTEIEEKKIRILKIFIEVFNKENNKENNYDNYL